MTQPEAPYVRAFTPRESGVAACILDSLTDKETARAMGITLSMVYRDRNHLKNYVGATSAVNLALKLERMTTS